MLDIADITPERPRPLRRVEYDLLVEHGRFAEERVELLEGVIVEMSPQGPAHANVVERLTRFLVLALQGRAVVRPQSAFAASDSSEPEPDLAVVEPGRGLTDPHPREAFLIVEVADSSLLKDRGLKSSLYARAGVPEYWIVDLRSREIEVRGLLVIESAYFCDRNGACGCRWGRWARRSQRDRGCTPMGGARAVRLTLRTREYRG
jgi:Uma2 family endonuclease